MKDHGQQARASENFAGPVDLKHHGQICQYIFKLSEALVHWPCWSWSFISPDHEQDDAHYDNDGSLRNSKQN